MIILQVEHPVPDFDVWKESFDNDPLHRKQSGVKSYRIFRIIGNKNYVLIELDFDNLENAERMKKALEQLWTRVEGQVMMNPQSRIVEVVEKIEY